MQGESYAESFKLTDEKRRREYREMENMQINLLGTPDSDVNNHINITNNNDTNPNNNTDYNNNVNNKVNNNIKNINNVNVNLNEKFEELEDISEITKENNSNKKRRSVLNSPKILSSGLTELITTYIPEEILLSNNYNDILYKGMLFRYVNDNKNYIRKAINNTYLSRFFVITKKNITAHKSKETFLMLQNPVLSIDFENITSVVKLAGQNEFNSKKTYYIEIQYKVNDYNSMNSKKRRTSDYGYVPTVSNTSGFGSNSQLRNKNDNVKYFFNLNNI
jgi:hypothetical protein